MEINKTAIKEYKGFGVKYWLMKQKKYFDTGLSFTHYIKWLIVFFGITTMNVNAIMWMGVGYAIFSYVLGLALFRYGWVTAGQEVTNQYDIFVKELRELKAEMKKKRKV